MANVKMAQGFADSKMTSKLPRTLGLWSSVALVIGITIGSGIFRSPAGIAQKVSDPRVMLLLWLAGGAITLCGALSLGELGPPAKSALPALERLGRDQQARVRQAAQMAVGKIKGR